MFSGGLIVSNTSIGRGKKGSKFWMQTLTTIGNVKELMNPPFEKPISFIRLFDSKRQEEIVS